MWRDFITREYMTDIFTRRYLSYWWNNGIIKDFENMKYGSLNDYVIDGFVPDKQEIRRSLLFYFYMNDVEISQRNKIFDLFDGLGIENDIIVDEINSIVENA